VSYALKKRWRDGTTAVVLSPGVLIERLLALGRARPEGRVRYRGRGGIW